MRRIILREPTTSRWRKWCDACDKATAELIQAAVSGRDLTIQSSLYKRMKYVFFTSRTELFRGKCAYCERDLSSQHGDVEHYRPKLGTTDADDKPVVRQVGGRIEAHRGYYWLAYRWTNLLPSCQICNVGNTEMSSGGKPGKRSRFPLEDEAARAWAPTDKVDERPMLLNPTVENPSDHLRFEDNGMIGWKTSRGHATVRILGLNDYGMPEQRLSRYKEVKVMATSLIHQTIDGHSDVDKERDIGMIRDGHGTFSSFALLGLSHAFRDAEQRVQVARTRLSRS